MAGTIGSNRAKPRLSPPSASSAICCAAMAASHELRVENIAPAMAVPASDEVVNCGPVRGFGRFWREMGSFVELELRLLLINWGLGDDEELMMHLAFSIAIVAMVVAAIANLQLAWRMKMKMKMSEERNGRAVPMGDPIDR